ncbi:1059_t:CDS:2, partial [Gigaspora margarita]
FLEDDYEEPQILISMALENCFESVYSKEGLLLKENGQEESIWLIQTEAILQTGTFQTLNTICRQKISNKSFISSNSRKDYIAIVLGSFIKKQSTYNMQNDYSTESLENTNSNLMELSENTDSIYTITDPLQHKERGDLQIKNIYWLLRISLQEKKKIKGNM